LFIFILVWNFSGLLPGIDTITVNVSGETVSLFRSFTTDLNSTLAMAIISMATVEYYGVKELGGFGYFRHFFKSWKPMDLFIGVSDVFTELMRLVTLALRLFGVIYGGEALLSAVAQLGGNLGWAFNLPIMVLEIFFCLVQAYLFMMLTTTYIVMATTHEEKAEPGTKRPARAEAAA
jgi:F-type H+-transporting ATPase subunit a